MMPLPSPTPSGARWPRRAAASPCPARPGQRIAAVLQHEPPVVRGLGRLHGVRLALGVMPKPLEHRLVFLRRDPLLLDASAHRHQEEHRPHGDPLRGQQLGHGVDLMDVAAGDRGVHLHGHFAACGRRRAFAACAGSFPPSRGRRRAWRRRRRRG